MFTLDMIKYVTLLRVFKKKDENSNYDYLSHRLESIPASSYQSWFDRNKDGKYNIGFDVYLSNKEMDHQQLAEFKLELGNIYLTNKDNIYNLNSEFENWIKNNFTKIEFII